MSLPPLSIPLVMAPTPVPPTRRQGITVPPAPCPALPLVHWAGPDLVARMPPHRPLRHLPLHSKYSSGSLSLQILAKVI